MRYSKANALSANYVLPTQVYPAVLTLPAPTPTLAGERRVYGGNGWIDGPLDEASKQQALGKLSVSLQFTVLLTFHFSP